MKITSSLAGLFALAVLTTTALAGDKPPVIAGRWASVAPEAEGKIFATRESRIDNKIWSVVFRTFADAAAKQPLFRIEVGGVYRIGGPSPSVPGAHEGIFPAVNRAVVAESPAEVAFFANAGCKLEQGVAKQLVGEACGFLPSLMQSMGEYDLVALHGGKLFFGDRSGDLGKVRPAKLTPYPLIKR